MIGRTALAALALAALLAGQTAAADSVLRRDNGAEPGTLDPEKFNTIPEDHILGDLFEGLTAPGPGGAIVPGAARSWNASADGLDWTFALRPDGHWSNGDAVTAEDFVYSLRRQVDPANAFYNSFLADPIANAVEIRTGIEKDLNALGVRAIDPLTLEIHLKAPNPALPAILARLRPVHRPSVEAFGRDAFRPGNLVSNGAYRLVEWRPQARIVLERNPDYWDRAHVAIDRVEFYPIEDQNEALKRYRADGLDMTDEVPHDQFALIHGELAAEYRSNPELGIFYIGFNEERPPFKDNPALRRALSLAIDRPLLVAKVVGGGTVPAYGWIPPGIKDYPTLVPCWAELPTAERLKLARAAYAEAGYGPGKPLTLSLLYNTSENNKKIMIAVAGMWKQALGVEVTLENQEFKTFLDTRKQKKATEAFRAAFISFYDDPAPLAESLVSTSAYNDLGYQNPAYDALYAQANAAATLAERYRLFAKAEAVALADQPVAPIFFYAAEHLIKPYVTGWQPSPRDSYRSQDLTVAPH
ncbi:MAG TPA: peptide ABC transporter substrate-binding protein [Aliidongia sp.]|nr:peptide ABC transporter substrate-binding protein [Aliidongia sp.]